MASVSSILKINSAADVVPVTTSITTASQADIELTRLAESRYSTESSHSSTHTPVQSINNDPVGRPLSRTPAPPTTTTTATVPDGIGLYASSIDLVSSTTGTQVHQRGVGGRPDTTTDLILEDTEEYPEGGKDAWRVVGGSFLGLLSLFGTINSMGAIQAYVTTHQLDTQTESQVSWIFSTFMFLTYIFSGQVGALFDSYGPYHLGMIGTFVFIVGIMLTSIAKTYYQFFLAFGIGCGVGGSLLMTPLVATVGHWFNHRRGVALGLATTGGSLGGVIFPIMLRRLYTSVGYAWAIRIYGFICLALYIASLLLIKPRLEKAPLKLSMNSIIDLKSLREARFAWLVLGNFLGDLGVVNGITYLTSYALAQGQSEPMSYALLAILNSTGILGRWFSGLFADKFGRFNTLIGSSLLASVSIFAVWLPFGKSTAGLIAFALFHGFCNGGIQNLAPVCVGQISQTKDYGKRYGSMYFFGSFGILLGIPLSGALIKGSNYQYLILFTGFVYFATASVVFLSRYASVGFKVCKI